MGIRSFFTDLFEGGPPVNPATGLPMPGGAVDVAGNPYGADLRRHHEPVSAPSGPVDLHHHAGSPTTNDWSSPSGPDHSSSTSWPSGCGYDPTRGW